jgi:hypothetical protein
MVSRLPMGPLEPEGAVAGGQASLGCPQRPPRPRPSPFLLLLF